LHNPQNEFFSLALKLGTYTSYLLLVVVYSIEREERKKERKKERKEFQSTSTCMFNVHSTFICFCTLSLIVGHH
jgi:hypothetical protein